MHTLFGEIEDTRNKLETLKEARALQNMKEVYSTTNMKPVENIFKAFIKFLKHEITPSEYSKVEDQNKVIIDIVDESSENYLVNKASYNNTNKYIYIYLYNNTVERILEDEKLIDQLEQEFFDEFVHEDTHLQQYQKKNNDNIKYNVPKPISIDYAKHYTEIDAYARQTAYILKQEFPGLSAKEIVSKIEKNEVKNKKAKDFIKTYKHPIITNKESNKFFATLWECLNGEEA